MTVRKMVELAEDLERHLGDPHDPAVEFSFAEALRHDELEQYPHRLLGTLWRWGVHEYCLPEQWGGRAGDVEVGLTLLRLVARRDPTTATALMITNIAFMPLWTAGTAEQRTEFIAKIKNGEQLAWGISERAHGSDVLANEMRAERVPGGYLVTGEKYLIGNATVAGALTLQVRTGERGGPADWTILELEKRHAPAGSVRELRNERLHGLRALDLSGIRVEGVFVPERNRVGAEGQGLELMLKGAQVARAMINGLALGAVDTALRVTCDFVVERELFGQKVSQIPYSRRQLAESFADLLLAEAAVTGAVRGLQGLPAQTGIFAAAVKFFVPTLLERTMAQLSVVLGARSYLREHPHYGVHQKLTRDILVAGFADGNTVVNLKSVAAQLIGIFAAAESATADSRAMAEEVIGPVFDLDAELPQWNPADQQLVSRDGDAAVLALPGAIAALRTLARRHPGAQREWFERSADLADALLVEFDRLGVEVTRLRAALGRAFGTSAELFRLAELYCGIHAAAAMIHLTVRSAHCLTEPFPNGAVLLVCLERVWRTFHPADAVADAAVTDAVLDVLLGLHGEGKLFSQWPIRLRTGYGTKVAAT